MHFRSNPIAFPRNNVSIKPNMYFDTRFRYNVFFDLSPGGSFEVRRLRMGIDVMVLNYGERTNWSILFKHLLHVKKRLLIIPPGLSRRFIEIHNSHNREEIDKRQTIPSNPAEIYNCKLVGPKWFPPIIPPGLISRVNCSTIAGTYNSL